MADLPRTFTFSKANQIADFTGIGGIGTGLPGQGGIIVGYTPNPFDLSDIPGSSAGLMDYCDCDVTKKVYTNLHVAPHPWNHDAYLFQIRPIAQYVPVGKDANGDCVRRPVSGLQNSVRYHHFQDGTFALQKAGVQTFPEGDFERPPLRDFLTDKSAVSKIDERGYQHMYGDGPGYRYGKEISFESGRIASGALQPDIIKTTELKFTAETSPGGSYTKITGTAGKYLHTLRFFYSDEKLNDEKRFHLLFKYNVPIREECGQEAYVAGQVLEHEQVIDNVAIVSSAYPKQTPMTAGSPEDTSDSEDAQELVIQYIEVDCRFTTCDFIELWGYQPKLTKIEALWVESRTYFDNVLKAKNIAPSFDARGRMFVFYEDEMDFTQLPYSDLGCFKKPTQPSNVTVTAGSAILAWQSNPTDELVTSYSVYKLKEGEFSHIADVTDTAYVDRSGSYGDTYQITANNVSGEGPGTPVTLEPPSVPSDGGGGGIGNGGGGGGGGAGGGGGGGGGGNGGNGGIPGNAPSSVTLTPSSSTSSPPQPPPTPPPSSSTSGPTPDTTPPSPVENPSGRTETNAAGTGTTVVLNWDAPGSNQPSSSTGGSGSIGTGNADVDHYNISHSLDPDGPFVKIGESTTLTFSDANAVLNAWNYYRVTAVDHSGNESGFSVIEVFATVPKPCEGRDCLGCQRSNYRSKNSFRVFFSPFSGAQLSFKCDPCTRLNGKNEDGFVRILNDGFFESTELVIGGETRTFSPLLALDESAQPRLFCLLPNCDDKADQKCQWTNTFFMQALVYKCKDYSCNDDFEKILIPMTVTLEQTQSGWNLEAYATGPDCKKLQIFKANNVLTSCTQPERFLNELEVAEIGKDEGTQPLSQNFCAVYPPDEYKQFTGTISCAMSPDLGRTWYQFRGLINLTQDRKAVNPFITHDPKRDIFHLFWVERDFIDEDNTLLQKGLEGGITGFDAYLKHKEIPAVYFKEIDAFKTFMPSPSSADFGEPSSSSSGLGEYAENQLKSLKYTNFGELIRRIETHTILHEEFYQGKHITLTEEFNSAYVDAAGRLFVVRFGQSGTLVDPPNRLTRRRRRKVPCGSYTWTVSGITDKDCACQALLGVHTLEFDEKTATFQDSKWTLAPSSTYDYWEIKVDTGTITNEMLIFHKKRNLSLCPPTGTYKVICQRCSGNIVGTLENERIGVYGNNLLIDSADVPASQQTGTDLGLAEAGKTVSQLFTIRNNRVKALKLSATPAVQIVGPGSNEFSIEQQPRTTLNAHEQTTFEVVFNPINRQRAANELTVKAQVRIPMEGEDTYFFNIQGHVGVHSSATDEAVSTFAAGSTFSADAIGTVLYSTDGGSTWVDYAEQIKTGQYGTAIYDQNQKAAHVVYYTNDMLFARRYPAISYTKADDELSDLDEAFDGFNIVQPPEVIIPNTDPLQNGIPTSIGDFLSMPTFFDLPNINIPSEVIDTFEEDLTSKKTDIKNERDPKGLPVFLAGSKDGALINGLYPYPVQFVFGEQHAVAPSKPAVYITPRGEVRFFFLDANGNVNAGTLSGESPTLDSKTRF